MSAEIISLGGLDEQDDAFMAFIEELKEGNSQAIFLLEKEDGTVSVGCNYKTKPELVFALYRLQGLAQSIVAGDTE